MCQKQEKFDLKWPFDQNYESKIIACNRCFYPIALEEDILSEIKDRNNITFGLVVPIDKLLKELMVYPDDPLYQWKTEVYCAKCKINLTFMSHHSLRNHYKRRLRDFEKITCYTNNEEKVTILWTFALFRGSNKTAFSRFIENNH